MAVEILLAPDSVKRILCKEFKLDFDTATLASKDGKFYLAANAKIDVVNVSEGI